MLLYRLFATNPSLGPLFARLALGGVMLPHGAQKVFEKGIGPTTQGFIEGGFPAPIAFMGAIAELLGGILVVLGLFTRLGALMLAVQMGVAATMHFDNGFYMNWMGKQAGEGFEYHLLCVGLGLALTVLGGGAASVDIAIARKLAARSVRTTDVIPGSPPPRPTTPARA